MKYALDLLLDTGFLESKPVTTPMVKNTHLHQNDSNLYHDPITYRQLVGRLLYLTNIMPDLSFYIQQLSQSMAAPTMNHYKALTRVLRYIKISSRQGLFYPTNSIVQIKGFTNSDWTVCPDTRRSISGYCMFLGDALIYWKSKKQITISRSSSKAEYRALAISSYEQPALLYCDNDSARYIVANLVFNERTKHIEIDCHVARERLQNKLYDLLPINSEQQTVDILTK
ncbi:PREDICTED: uncharacterized protein LOC109340603, partial [Lupinus angustifolius]|uniref:uncharacterized protein LOC109340603 n=1 Tax=Lupinus angustifolius TaxID=3871 RepID=UPI00092E39FD